ncbi:MAG: hypothetical protein Q9223_000335 [Gallowayella weberi]
MEDNHFDHHPTTIKHEQDIDIDENLLARVSSLFPLSFHTLPPPLLPAVLSMCSETLTSLAVQPPSSSYAVSSDPGRKLPKDSKLKSAKGAGESNWNLTGHIIFETEEGKEEECFIKVRIEQNFGSKQGRKTQAKYKYLSHSITKQIATGTLGKAMFAGEFASMTALHSAIPKHVPRPLSWGAFATGDRYFQLYTFHRFVKGLKPSIPDIVSVAASLHSADSSLSPTGKFGFEMTTYNGNLPQDNRWTKTWEEFYSNGMRRMLDLDAKARGESKELKGLEGDFFEKVVPRLLRPMETLEKGRSIKPVLLHGDLWIGNASVEEKGMREEENCMLFDSSAFYGHNESDDLSPMYLLRNDWGRGCLEAYHRIIPKSEPLEDWETRIELYALREQFHDSVLFPDIPYFRECCIKTMKKLVEQFPNGYEE